MDPVLPERRPQRAELRLVAGETDENATSDFRRVSDELYQPVANYLFRRLGDRHGTEDRASFARRDAPGSASVMLSMGTRRRA